MSYWVLITSYSFQDKDSEKPTMGSPETLRRQISALFPDTDWSDPTYGTSDESGLDFMLPGPEKAAENLCSFSIRLGGEEDPVPAIHRLCKQYGWFASDEEGGDMDMETGEFVYEFEDENEEESL